MESDIPVVQKGEGDLHLETLPPATKKAFLACAELSFLEKDWYLAGGTALALQAGHRASVDLDFFTPRQKFEEVATERILVGTGNWQTDFREEGTIYGKFLEAKMSLIAYPFFVPAKPFIEYGAIRILASEDVASMKIIAISQRGKKRDFFDLYWYIKNREPLTSVIRRSIKQYPGQEHNLPHFLKSLTYFADAEDEPMPNIFFEATWTEVKDFFQVEAVKATHELLGA